MRTTLATLWAMLTTALTMLNKFFLAGDAIADYAKESAEELRDEARIERSARLKTIEHQPTE